MNEKKNHKDSKIKGGNSDKVPPIKIQSIMSQLFRI